MNGKLQEMETQFTNTLRSWKQNLDSKLTTLTSTYEESRKTVEENYLTGLQQSVIRIQDETTGNISDIVQTLETTKNDMQSSIQEMQSTLSEFEAATKEKLTQITQSSEATIREKLEVNTNSIHDSMSKYSHRLLNHFSLLKMV